MAFDAEGNGARGALIGIALEFPETTEKDAACWCDWLLAALWIQGFKVVPLEPEDDVLELPGRDEAVEERH